MFSLIGVELLPLPLPLLPPQAVKKTSRPSNNKRDVFFMGDLPEVKGASRQIERGNSSGAWESARRQFSRAGKCPTGTDNPPPRTNQQYTRLASLCRA